MTENMVMRQVEYYLAVCRERNFTRAAKSCGVSQPSLTNGIKTLERECGGKLFSRSFCSPAELTALGEALRPYFATICHCAEQIRLVAETSQSVDSRVSNPDTPHPTAFHSRDSTVIGR